MATEELQERKHFVELNGVTCKTCGSNDLDFIQIIQVGEKEIQGTIPVFVKGCYKRIILRSAYRCKNCGRVTTYQLNEA